MNALPTSFDRLAYLIGRVCIADVWLEQSLRQVHRALVGTSLAVHITPRDFGGIYDECREMAKHGLMGVRLRAAVVAALTAANNAHGERNRVAHDMWLFVPDSDAEMPTWNRVRAKIGMQNESEHKTLADVEKARNDIARAMFRLNAITFLLPEWDPFPFHTADEREANLETVEGKFDMASDGSYRLHRHSASEPAD